MDIILAHLIRMQYNLTHRDEKGATAVEYGLLVGLIAAAIIVIVTTLGGTIAGMFTEINDQL